jgi:4-alpha-glucanotransferase
MRRGHQAGQELRELATACGVETTYIGADDEVHEADPQVVLSILHALGVAVDHPRDAGPALRIRRHDAARRIVEPVIALRDTGPSDFVITVPEDIEVGTLWLSIEFDDGSTHRGQLGGNSTTMASAFSVDRQRFLQFRVNFEKIGVNVPLGYHSLSVEGGASHSNVSSRSLLICAPRCPQPARGWGVFMPLHALRSERDWGVGSYPDMASLGEWARSHGASMMGGLPLYPTYLDPPIDPSPYRPVSRLAYNEIYIDPESLPELEQSSTARELMNSTDFRTRVSAARASSIVEYEEVARLRRQVLEPMAEALVQVTSRRRDEFSLFIRQHPELVAYGQFRAAVERDGRRDVVRASQPLDKLLTKDPIANYFVYCQWVASQQLGAAANNLPLYADLPVGVHPEGFDPHWSPASFVYGVSGGAPPDLFFASGQNWAFSPLHPQAMRDDHYQYLRAVFARAFRHASYVRVDHIMGLQRLYVVPEGNDAVDGAYLSYRADELHALVSLEAYRAGASVIGEDLGTVPEGVRERMARDGMLRSWVFEFKSTLDDPLPEAPRDVLASLATHDMPRFVAFLWGYDIDESEKIGQLSSPEADARRAQRALYREALFEALDVPVLSDSQLTDAAREGCVAHVSASAALLVLVDLEEIWGESEPQNRPGTIDGNWRQRAALTLEEIRVAPKISAELDTIDRLRRGAA